MSQAHALTKTQPNALQQLQSENEQLKKYLTAQKTVIASLERRVGRSLDTLESHLRPLVESLQASPDYYNHLSNVQNEVHGLCDLIADTMLLQKLEAGKVDVKLAPLALEPLLGSVSRHLLEPRDGRVACLICEIDIPLPLALADQDLTEAVLTDLLARGSKYSDIGLPVVLSAEHQDDRIHLRITAQRFAPAGNRDFATEIILCCRRIEVQRGTITCQQHPDGLQTVTVSLYTAARSAA
ncbi:MAG: DUF3450 domain-containing protein [Stenomitos rutilans HA7619-LM2]|jgi:K+-sensing histidine kinase KdpD|nr:DUF3450 domain-containing protein [Stenomitos rutilans HA7619-LM2]